MNLSNKIRSLIHIAGGHKELLHKLHMIPDRLFYPNFPPISEEQWEKIGLIRGTSPSLPIELTVNYGFSLSKLLSLAGIEVWNKTEFKRLQLVSSSEGKKKFLFDVLKLPSDMETKEVFNLLTEDDWQHAEIEHLLTFAHHFPDAHHNFGEISATGCWLRQIRRKDVYVSVIYNLKFKRKIRRLISDHLVNRYGLHGVLWEKDSAVLRVKPI
jgi:hypothetical protein